MTTNRSRAPITRGLIIAGALLGAALALRVLTPAHVDPETARRILGVLMGVVVIVYANEVPKLLPPLRRLKGDPAADQAMRRFTGWSLVLGGAGYAAAWASAPMAYANPLAGTLLGAALLLGVLRIGQRTSTPSRS